MQLSQSHFLICRTDNIGDLVLTLPLAGFLKQQFPGCRITFLVRGYAEAVARRCRFVDAVLTLEALTDPAAQLAAGAYDVVLFAFPQRKLAQASKQAKIRWRVGTSHRLYHWLYCNKLAHFSRVHSPLHEAQLNFALLAPLGLNITPTLQQIWPWYGLQADAAAISATEAMVKLDKSATPAESEATAAPIIAPQSALPSAIQLRPALFQNNRFNLILHPKSNGNGREWPLRHFLELARQLQPHPEIQIWISGSAQEGQLMQQAVPELFTLPNVESLCGHCTLPQFVDLIGTCDGLVASGTGPLHIAASMGRRTLGLFPPIKPIDIARWGALGSQAENLCLPQPCRACPGAQDCACMAALPVNEVKARILAWRQAATT